MPTKPEILDKKVIAKTKVFCVEELSLKFSNGEKRIYERLVAGKNGAVMVLAVNDNDELLLIKEYSAGTDDYQLAFPKGLIETNEAVSDAANRELKEEVGFGAKQLIELKSISLAPGYLSHKMNLVLAKDLYEEKLEGDEPEPLEVVPWPIHQMDQLLERSDFTEARSIAALFILENYFK
jgi:ADP-ribose diphosphatase